VGDSDRKIAGLSRTFARPATARIVNHVAMTGPNRRPTASVPKRWIANSAVSTVSVIGSTSDFSPGAATFSPSTAESTEIAGVIIPSP
jgi:hypothetical protein